MSHVPPVENANNPEQQMAYQCELVATHGANSNEARNYWPTVRPIADKYADPDPKPGGSQNHPVAAMVLLAAMEKKTADWEDLYLYCRLQLAGTGNARGLWGTESLSMIYPHPPAYLALADREARRQSRATGAGHNGLICASYLAKAGIVRCLEGHALLMALLAVDVPYVCEAGEKKHEGEGAYDSAGLPVHVLSGGERSQWPYRGGVVLDYIFACMLGSPPPLPTWRGIDTRVQGALCRIMRELSPQRWLTSWMCQVINNRYPDDLVANLEDIGVKSHVPLTVYGYPNGSRACFHKQSSHASTPPLLGQTLIMPDRAYRTLGAHPENLRGTSGGNKVGNPSICEPVGFALACSFQDAIAGGSPEKPIGAWPPGTTVDRKSNPGLSEAGTFQNSILLPTGDPSWTVVINANGIKSTGLGDSGPIDPPPIDPPPVDPDPDPPNGGEMTEKDRDGHLAGLNNWMDQIWNEGSQNQTAEEKQLRENGRIIQEAQRRAIGASKAAGGKHNNPAGVVQSAEKAAREYGKLPPNKALP